MKKVYEVNAYEGDNRINWVCSSKKQAMQFIKRLEEEQIYTEIWLRTWKTSRSQLTMEIEENQYITGEPF